MSCICQAVPPDLVAWSPEINLHANPSPQTYSKKQTEKLNPPAGKTLATALQEGRPVMGTSTNIIQSKTGPEFTVVSRASFCTATLPYGKGHLDCPLGTAWLHDLQSWRCCQSRCPVSPWPRSGIAPKISRSHSSWEFDSWISSTTIRRWSMTSCHLEPIANLDPVPSKAWP